MNVQNITDTSALNVTIHSLTPASSEWTEWLGLVLHDSYHTAAYHRLAQAAGEGEPFLLVYGTRERFLAWPYLLRRVASHDCACDITSVYGYAGPLWKCDISDHDFQLAAIEACLATWKQQNIISLFCRMHPILGNGEMLLSPDVALTYQGQTVSIPLTCSQDDRWDNFRRQLRQHIKKCERMGFHTVFDAEWRYFEEFFSIYTETMDRNHADESFFYSRDYFLRLKAALGEHASLAVCLANDEVASAALVLEQNGFVHPHLAGTKSTYLRYSPLKMLFSELADWGAARGNRMLHLGGGRGASDDDDLFRFKSEFSTSRHGFYTARIIVNSSLYQELSLKHNREAQTRGQAVSDTTYFPAYRAPLVPSTLRPSEILSSATGAGLRTSPNQDAAGHSVPSSDARPRKVLVVGSSGHARVVIDILVQLKTFSVHGIVDSYAECGTFCGDIPILGTEHDMARLIDEHDVYGVVVAIGDNYVRMQMVEILRKTAPGLRFITAIHPNAYVAPDVRFGEGTVVMAGTVINTGSIVKDHCIINTNASLDHDGVMEDYSSLGPNAAAGGNVTVGKCTAISLGANVIHRINIGEHTVIGAGAAVIKDIPSYVVALGVPARVARTRQAGDRYL